MFTLSFISIGMSNNDQEKKTGAKTEMQLNTKIF